MLERRHHKGDCEIRATASGKPMIAGYAAVFGKRSQDLGGFVEDIHPGAFERTLRTADVRALANHDANMLLGRSKSGTLRLGTDSGGLHYEIDPNMDDPAGRSAVARVERGDWDGSSFSFRTVGLNGDKWDYGTDPAQRTLLEVELYDVGPVTFPAYPDASSVVRGAVELLAQRESRSVDELATALQTGSLRQLLGQAVELPVEATADSELKADAPAEDHRGEVEVERERIHLRARAYGLKLDEPAADDDDLAGARILHAFVEERAGKTLSAASISAIRAAMDALENLIAAATGGDTETNAATGDAETRADGTSDRQSLLDTMNVAAQSFIAGSGDGAEAIAMQEIIVSLNDLSEQLAGPNPADSSE